MDHHYDSFYINGKWVKPVNGSFKLHEVTDASTEEVFATVPNGSSADVDVAVKAASAAFPKWSATSLAHRKDLLTKLCEGIQNHSSELARVISRELGMPIKLAKSIQVGTPIGILQSLLAASNQIKWEEVIPNQRGAKSLVIREAYGVVSCITPWNYPLMQIATKVFPALLAGCTVVVKPSENAPLDANILAEIIDEIGFPAGVFNLVHGSGIDVGEHMCTHPLVDMVSFTGSTAAGMRVGQLAAKNIKKCKLELGGKSAHIILDDADLDSTLPKSIISGILVNSGQTCSALSRLLVPRAMQDEVVEIAKGTFESMPVGPSSEKTSFVGPLISKIQQQRVRSYIQAGINEGASLVTGGTTLPDGVKKGYFVKPTIFKDVNNSMKIAQEEIFGPVLCIIPYDSEQEAIDIANDSPYGLSGAVSSSNVDRAVAVAKQIRTGEMIINGAPYNVSSPFGGYKMSGVGREKGVLGIEEFLQIKSLNLPKAKM